MGYSSFSQNIYFRLSLWPSSGSRLTSWSWETSWVLTQDSNWLESNPRDILDESDKILSAWFELIHTIIDLQRAIEFSPDRSTIIEDILWLVNRFAQPILRLFPQGLGTTCFPREMKEFAQKLSSSGWDIARAKVHLMTDCRGTNGSRYFLQLSISHCDLLPQLQTSAANYTHSTIWCVAKTHLDMPRRSLKEIHSCILPLWRATHLIKAIQNQTTYMSKNILLP